MDSREELPRISVGSVQDWNRLKTNYKAAALESLEERITTERLHNERDAMIAHANQHVDTEPFDEALDRRIWSLADTRLQWQKRIAETRRTLPQEIESSILDLLDQQRVSDREETIAMAMPAVDDAKGEEHGGNSIV
ncbi:hypothetical protein H0H81_011317 [Sphagnurus paluster]|uniref:Uncharacterized protein n=1 Tax=Sphagnurus paluster TaxID=117069 RepID=A0A9P7FV67_9AGAR|nr:hypothetical protein H0H81_011317 [Sphagnurus paluster]